MDKPLNALVWQIPLGVLMGLVIARLLLAPYWIYAAREKRMILIRVINEGNHIIKRAWQQEGAFGTDDVQARAEVWSNLARLMLKRHAPVHLPVYDAQILLDRVKDIEPAIRAVVIGWTTERVRRLNSIMDSLSETDKAGN